ncbi:hypothetical protein NSTCB13_05766 [Nostoc sp. DSM 114160]
MDNLFSGSPLLRDFGHDVLTVQEAENADQGIPDEEVLAFAISQERSELIRKENLKDTQLVTRSEFQRISIFLTQIPEILARQVLYLSLQISSQY